MSQPELLEAVRRREVDFGIGPQPDRAGELGSQVLFEDSYVAVVPADHRAAGKATISLRELAKLQVLALSVSQFQRHLKAALAAEALTLEPAYEFTHVHSVLTMIEAGLGVGILPGVAVPQNTTLKTLRIVRPTMTRSIAVIKIRGHSLSPAAAQFVALCDTLIPPRIVRGG